LVKTAIVDSQGFAAPAKVIFTNSLQNLFGFQSSPRAESISVVTFAALAASVRKKGRPRMQDALMLLFTIIFFAVAFLYVKACQKLR
jgi:hypothetical protein